jgi:hypothetical protein
LLVGHNYPDFEKHISIGKWTNNCANPLSDGHKTIYKQVAQALRNNHSMSNIWIRMFEFLDQNGFQSSCSSNPLTYTCNLNQCSPYQAVHDLFVKLWDLHIKLRGTRPALQLHTTKVSWLVQQFVLKRNIKLYYCWTVLYSDELIMINVNMTFMSP